MAYRAIHTKIWDDPWFLEELGPDGKLLFFYLCTNGATNILGLYELSLRKAAAETGLDIERVGELLEDFRQAGKVETEGYWIWVRNLMRYNAENMSSGTVKAHIEKILADVPSSHIKTLFCEYYSLPIPCAYPTDTARQQQQIRSEADTATDQQQQQQQDTGADAPELPAAADSGDGDVNPHSLGLLTQAGVGEPNASRLAAKCEPATIEAFLVAMPQQRGLTNPAGWLVKQLDSGKPPPRAGPSRRERYAGGAYADCVET